jgi:hypothetical protein
MDSKRQAGTTSLTTEKGTTSQKAGLQRSEGNGLNFSVRVGTWRCPRPNLSRPIGCIHCLLGCRSLGATQVGLATKINF